MSATTPQEIAQTGQIFRKDLTRRWAVGKIGNEDLCTISYLHTRSNGVGVEDLALNPALRGRNAARHVRDVFGLNDTMKRMFQIQVPIWNNEQSLREVIAVYVRLPHEVLARDYVRRQHLYARRGIDPADYSFDAYLKHPVTLEFGAPNVFPV